MKPQSILDKAIVAKALRLRTSGSSEIYIRDSKYIIRIYKNKNGFIVLTVLKRENKIRETIGYYLSEQVEKELTTVYPKSQYSIFVYEDIQKMIERDKTYDQIISDSKESIKELKEGISIEKVIEKPELSSETINFTQNFQTESFKDKESKFFGTSLRIIDEDNIKEEPEKKDNSKLIQSLKRELNIIELKIQKEELLKRIEDAS